MNIKNLPIGTKAFTMIEVLGATGIVMLLTAIVGTSIMGVVDSSKDAAIERQLQTLNSAYQAYLAAGLFMKVF